MGVIQIDSVNVLARSEELVLFARLGPHRRDLIADASTRGDIYEYWVHEASYAPVDHHHLHRWRMAREHPWSQMRDFGRRRRQLIDAVERRITEEGPLTAGDLKLRVGTKGAWWDWDDGKIALEYLFWTGRIAARRRRTDFARVYDLPERIIPSAALDRPTPPEAEARKELLVLAARHHGIGTTTDLADYHRQKITDVRPLVTDLVDEGRLVEVDVEGWSAPAYMLPTTAIPTTIDATAVLSPFDPVIWNRDRAERLFDFRYRIEIYTPAARRTYGYYVMPILHDERLQGRLDLKADRAAGMLRVQAAHAEPDADRDTLAPAVIDELNAMASWLGLDRVQIARRGNLAGVLERSSRVASR